RPNGFPSARRPRARRERQPVSEARALNPSRLLLGLEPGRVMWRRSPGSPGPRTLVPVSFGPAGRRGAHPVGGGRATAARVIRVGFPSLAVTYPVQYRHKMGNFRARVLRNYAARTVGGRMRSPPGTLALPQNLAPVIFSAHGPRPVAHLHR